ncbi:DUF1176 domain-containing protein [Devosia sp.]|uniref:DUF1176 domain-containing protein n=1 Tax=Devosia sp. TaxID=1871048 RepID=UPI003A935FBD
MTSFRLLAALAVPVLLATPTLGQDASTNPVSGPYADYVPDTSLNTYGDAPPDTELAKRLFVLAFTEECSAAIDGGYGGIEPQIYDLSYRESYDDADMADRTFRLYQFTCDAGAYNVSSIFYGWDNSWGLRPLSFAYPTIEAVYGDTPDTATDAPLEQVDVKGMSSRFRVTNPKFNADMGAIEATSYWRGIGDASDSAVWAFEGGEFVLKRYDVDASYDGEINPETVYDVSGS